MKGCLKVGHFQQITYQEFYQRAGSSFAIKSVNIRDTVIAIDLGVEIPQNIADMNWSLVDMDKLDASKIDPKLINDHPEFEDLKPIIGEFTSEKIADVFMNASQDAGLGISIAVCLNKNTQAKFEADKDLRQFCSTATNWSSYQIMKSRASGYVSGKKFKVKLQEWNRKRNLKREERKRAREASRVNLA